MHKIVLASGNAGKVREFNALLSPCGFEVIPQKSLGVSDAEEPFDTFVENALAKARHASLKTGLPALADDSGICVAALDGRPGVHSARYAALGDGSRSDEANNAKLIADMQGVADRRASYVCVLVLIRHAGDPSPLIAQAHWSGELIASPRGSGGFGYDPYFLLPELGCTAAELDPARKNLLSHRARACRDLLQGLQDAGGLGWSQGRTSGVTGVPR
jgi:XTP/dITP diphosphohydrolase